MGRFRAVCLAGVMTGALWLTPPGWTPSASALSCVEVTQQLPQLETIVQGEITAIIRGQVHLAVERYYKGSGPAELQGDVISLGQGHRMDWIRVPQEGDQVVIAFKRASHGLVNDICTPLVNLTAGERIDLAALGPGAPPIAPPDAPQGPPDGGQGAATPDGPATATDGPATATDGGPAPGSGSDSSAPSSGPSAPEAAAASGSLAGRLWPWATGALVGVGALLWFRRR